jgi:hypothetical protein
VTYMGSLVGPFVFAAASAAFLPNPSSRVSSHIREAIIDLSGEEMLADGFLAGARALAVDVAPCLPRIVPTLVVTGLSPFDF